MLQCPNCFRWYRDPPFACQCDTAAEDFQEADCTSCNTGLHLEDECEWPEQPIYCWSCAHKQLAKAEDVLLNMGISIMFEGKSNSDLFYVVDKYFEEFRE